MGRPTSLALAALLAACLPIACAGSDDDGPGGHSGSGGTGNSGGIASGGAWAGGTSGSGATGASAGAPGDDPCAGQADGAHCGSDLGGGADHLTLYTCLASVTTQASACAHGCTGGSCSSPPSDPCASAPGAGTYCGVSLAGGDSSTLYVCAGGQTTSTIACPAACQSNPPGTPDACASNDPCTGAYAGNGKYCGQALPGGSPNKLYTCSGGATTAAVTCNGACVEAPPGTPDACASGDPCQGANGGNGPYCGSSLPGGDANTLYHCTNLTTASTQGCPNGCQANPPGTPDACKSGGGDPCSSVASNGEYCGGSLSGGDPSKLYTCLNKTTSSVVTCSNGCKQNPPGTPDQCAAGGSGSCCVTKPPGSLTQGFTANCSANTGHFGMDYSASIGTPIYAGVSGTIKLVTGYPNCYDPVTKSCNTACYQSNFNYLRIKASCGDPNDAANDLYVYYLHIHKAAPGVSDGAAVKQGDFVAEVGNSGCSSGPHTHIEVVSVPKGASPSLHSCKSVNPTTRYCP